MEFVIGIVSSIFTTAAEYTISPIINHVKYLSSHQQNVETLKDQAEKLKVARDRVQHSVDAAQRNGEEIEHDVNNWMSAVERKIPQQVEKVMQDDEKAKKKCFIGLCPNFWTRYKYSLKVAEEAKAVAELLEQGKFDGVSYPVPLQSITVPPVKGYEDFESRTLVLNKIMEALKDDSVSVIGVHGMGGIGKTTLVKEIARKVKEKLFDSVVIATVTQTIDIEKIQNRIAELLGLKFEEQSTDGNALRLRERLKKEKRVLVVLDDIWGKVDIEEVGIPLGDEHKGCKLLLTSRELNVLSNEMDAQKCFAIGSLNELEAWDLFKKKAGDCVESYDLKPTATKVAKKCAGLPIAIATVAGALRNKRLFEWKNALRELERPSSSNFTGITAAYSAIEWSFNYLESEEVKLTFLLCCVIGHNGLVEKLMRYTVGLGLFGGVSTMDEARNKVLTVVANLKASSLLLDGYNDEHFDIHDVVSDAALVIASRDYRMLVLRDHVPMEWSDKKKMNSWIEIPPNFFRRIESLKVMDLRFRVLDLPYRPSFRYLRSINHLIDLRMLCLRECPVEDITIIGELQNLEILDLALSRIKKTTQGDGTIGSVKRKALLNGKIEGVVGKERRNAHLDELNNLPRLTTLHVHIPDVQMIPKHRFIETLDRYRILVGDYGEFKWYSDYEYSRTLKLKIYRNISSNNGVKMLLKKTEDLYLHLNGLEAIKSGLAELNSGEEFSNLRELIMKEYSTSSEPVSFVNKQGDVRTPLRIKNLKLYHLRNLQRMWRKDSELGHILSNLQTLTIDSCHDLINIGASSLSFKNLTTLKVSNCAMMTNLVTPLVVKNLVQLTTMEVSYCTKMTEIVAHVGDYHQTIVVGKLKCLKLSKLQNLKSFCRGSYTLNFPCLEEVVVDWCPKLKIFSEGVLSTPQLQSVKGWIFEKKGCWASDLNTTIQQLYIEKDGFCGQRNLTISDTFPKLIAIWKENPRAILELKNLSQMKIYKCSSLRYIFTLSMLLSLKQLERTEVEECNTTEQVIREDEKEATTHEFTFPRLFYVKLDACFNLTNFYFGSRALEFPKLSDITIVRCPKMTVFSSSISRKSEKVINEQGVGDNTTTLFCDKLQCFEIADSMCLREIIFTKEIVEEEEREDVICFPQLNSLHIKGIPDLIFFCSRNFNIEFPLLKELKIEDCPKLKEFISKSSSESGMQALFNEKVVVPSLETMTIFQLSNVKMIFQNDLPSDSFQNLRKLSVSGCESLKNLLPASIAKHLLQLEDLSIIKCGVEEIVSEEEGVEEQPMRFEFPKVSSLVVEDLKELKCFYKGPHTIVLPMLKTLRIDCSALLMIVGLEDVRLMQERKGNGEVFPNLEQLRLRDLSVPCKGDVGTLSPIKNMQLTSSKNLKHIWKKDSELGHILSNLQTLTIKNCDDLINIGALQLSFQNLTTLEVSYCKMMTNLVTPLVFEKMVQLITMRVSVCTEMIEIVANERDHQTIVLGNLKCLQLSNLKSLASFCPGSYTFNFPCLEVVVVEECPKLKIFSEGVLSTPQLQSVEQDSLIMKRCWAGDLNTTIQQLYIEKDGFYGLGDLTISDTFPELIEIWKKNPRAILELKNLSQMKFYKCSSLMYIFTPSMLLSLKQLRFIEVKECSIMEQVIREDEKEATTHELKFPMLFFVKMVSCSNLTNFYLGSRALEFPKLSNITIDDCPKMTALSSSISRKSEKVISEQDVKDNTTALFCDKCFPNLKLLNLQFFPEASTTLLYSFIRSLPKLQKLVINNVSISEIVRPKGLSHKERHTSTVSQLKELSLSELPELTLNTFFEGRNHKERHTSAFSQLKELSVSELPELTLKTLFEGLINEERHTSVCYQLEALRLSQLPELTLKTLEAFLLSFKNLLTSFSWRHSLEFPVLQMVIVTECPKMKNFCQGELSTPRLEQMHLTGDEDGELQWEGNLNTTIKHMFDQMNMQNSQAVEVTDQLHQME
ncbi:hypothetical protein CXB51_024988 [Gossypium anomalum]|uniref:AAA+ ATPase domain-containing protein n=1 Tax=Gossypium anomalum TaxID=47600 RepID=A0A8J5YIW8_9ROSI|nr:hypothetical protein CXB51_024988 [Gossypium anomalum]